MMLVDIIIVTYLSEKHIQACIESIMMQTVFSNCHVWIVDNNSQDNTLKVCENFIRPNITVISLKENIGFGRAINKAAEQAQASGEFIYLFNPDAILQTKNDLENLIKFSHAHPEAGIIGCKVLEPNGKEAKPQYSYPKQNKMPKSFLESLKKLPGEIAWLIGASMLIRKSVFDVVKGFDADFFLYGEEVDLCLRVRKAGFTIAWDNAVTVMHIGSASADQLMGYQKKVLKMQGLYLFLSKHYAKADVAHVISKDLRRARFRYWLARLFSSKKAEGYRAERDVAKTYRALRFYVNSNDCNPSPPGRRSR